MSLKGCDQDFGDLGGQKINSYYLEVPVHLGYKYAINNDFSIWGQAGPYVALGLFGKTKVKEMEDIEGHLSESSSDTFGDPGLKRFDIGAGLKAGVTFRDKYSFSIGYDWGFVDNYHGSSLEDSNDEECFIDATPSSKNKNLSISLGYTF